MENNMSTDNPTFEGTVTSIQSFPGNPVGTGYLAATVGGSSFYIDESQPSLLTVLAAAFVKGNSVTVQALRKNFLHFGPQYVAYRVMS
jgi:hypothetical protein